jgi:hypothetical protein
VKPIPKHSFWLLTWLSPKVINVNHELGSYKRSIFVYLGKRVNG